MKEPLLQEDEPGYPPATDYSHSQFESRPRSRQLAAEPHLAHPSPVRENLRSHFIFGPGFTQVLLLVCILMLGIVIGMKTSDYFHDREMEKDELAFYRASQAGRPTPPLQQAAIPIQPSLAVPSVVAPTQAAPALPAAPPVPLPVEAPPASPAKSTDFSNELALLQQERDLMRQRFDDLSQGAPPSRPGAASPEPSQPETGLPAAREPGTTKPPAAGPAANEVSAAEQRIRDAPALGKVLEYDADWHFVVISCGTTHNLEAGRKLAIRRGGTILGLIQVDEILPNQSVAELEGAWKGDPQAIKPQPGDDVLTFPPF